MSRNVFDQFNKSLLSGNVLTNPRDPKAIRTINFRSIFAPQYRAILLDVVAFTVNLVLMLVFTNLLADLSAQAGRGVPPAKVAMALFCSALVFLQPIGAFLKRQHAHQRNPELNTTAFYTRMGRVIIPFYFLIQLMFLIYTIVLLMEAFGQYIQISTVSFALLFLGIPILAGGNTFLVYHYFVPPKSEPFLKFLMKPLSEIIGDSCIFLGMFCFQVLWWYLLDDAYFSTRPNNPGEFVGKILTFGFMALFLYFPPRIFYLAEDPHPKTTWLRLFLANIPVILRILFGIGL